MKQINLHVTSEFLRELNALMKLRGIKTKAEAIRTAVRESVASITARRSHPPFHGWIGVGLKAPLRKARFKDEDSLWEKK